MRRRRVARSDDYRFWRFAAAVFFFLIVMEMLKGPDGADGVYLVGLSVAILGMQVSR